MRTAGRNLLVIMSALALTLICVRANAAAQQGKQEQGVHATKQEAALDLNNYRVKYKVDELENGKAVNSRSYTMMVKTGSSSTVRIGSRVPYNAGGNTYTYANVGMNIDCQLKQQEGQLIVHTKIDMSSVQGKAYESNPVFGSFQVENNAVVNLGKPEFVGSADDMSSNRHYVIEVTVTKAD